MVTNKRTKLFLMTLTFVCLNAAILSSRYWPAEVNAQVACREPPLADFGIRETWPKFSQVNVNIDSFWGGAKKDAIEKAFDNWEAAGAGSPNCSGMVYHPTTNNPVPDEVRDRVVRPANTVNVVTSSGPGHQVNTVGISGRIESQVIYLSSCKTELQKITSITAHEIGHSFGLENCTAMSNPSCTIAGQSIMGPSTGNPNEMGGCGWSLGTLEGPTFCDNTAVALYYCDIAGPSPPSGCDPAAESACFANGGAWNSSTCDCESYSCDPSGQQEMQCYSGGGTWDSYNCACEYPPIGCDPYGWEQQDCEAAGGVWDSVNCNCGTTSGCVLGPEEYVGQTTHSYTWYGYPDSGMCTDTVTTYRQCCEDGTNCREWEVYDSYCCTETWWGCQ